MRLAKEWWQKGDIKERLAFGISWNVLSVLFMQGSTFLVNVALANLLGRQHFGEFAVIQTTLMTVAGLGQMATGVTAAKYVAETRISRKRIAGQILGLCSVVSLVTGLVCCGLLFVRANWIAAEILNAPQLNVDLSIAAAVALFLTMNAYQVGALAGLEAFRSSAILSSTLGIFHVITCIVGAWLFGLDGALVGFLLSSAVRWACFGRLVQVEGRQQGIKTDWSGWRNQRQVMLG